MWFPHLRQHPISIQMSIRHSHLICVINSKIGKNTFYTDKHCQYPHCHYRIFRDILTLKSHVLFIPHIHAYFPRHHIIINMIKQLFYSYVNAIMKPLFAYTIVFFEMFFRISSMILEAYSVKFFMLYSNKNKLDNSHLLDYSQKSDRRLSQNKISLGEHVAEIKGIAL